MKYKIYSLIIIIAVLFEGCGIPQAKPIVSFPEVTDTSVTISDNLFTFTDDQEDYTSFRGYDFVYKIGNSSIEYYAIIKNKTNTYNSPFPTYPMLSTDFDSEKLFYIYFSYDNLIDDDYAFCILDKNGDEFNSSNYDSGTIIKLYIRPCAIFQSYNESYTDSGYSNYVNITID